MDGVARRPEVSLSVSGTSDGDAPDQVETRGDEEQNRRYSGELRSEDECAGWTGSSDGRCERKPAGDECPDRLCDDDR
ncbi:hypothetical protein GCM10025867_20040 [Frondihabitans sucicola]|uniref:Uncharacterized protein n=1 Tax=Frondihabitans sucicola TaxID=1268041 RepID=A0ABN6Y203_9MICO|nr:hypothetical protein [Frondihabitans sucicola]BDZ49763.1 hypothetical protein GCM10025867_20040 [Frondihabitans sucicola]